MITNYNPCSWVQRILCHAVDFSLPEDILTLEFAWGMYEEGEEFYKHSSVNIWLGAFCLCRSILYWLIMFQTSSADAVQHANIDDIQQGLIPTIKI